VSAVTRFWIADCNKLSMAKRPWWQLASRVRAEIDTDNLSIVAGGVAFYAFFAVFPALAALVSLNGLVSDPATVEEQIMAMGAILPGDVRDLIGEQMRRIAQSSKGALGWGAIFGSVVAGWSANKGVRGLRFAPDERSDPRWITPGALLATLLWVLVSIGFSQYVSRFGSYEKTCGSLGAVAMLLTWLYLSAYAVLIGAEVNAETESLGSSDSGAAAGRR
jgi:membrane protein